MVTQRPHASPETHVEEGHGVAVEAGEEDEWHDAHALGGDVLEKEWREDVDGHAAEGADDAGDPQTVHLRTAVRKLIVGWLPVVVTRTVYRLVATTVDVDVDIPYIPRAAPVEDAHWEDDEKAEGHVCQEQAVLQPAAHGHLAAGQL